MTDDFSEALKGAVSTAQIDHGRMAMFLRRDLTQDDIAEMYNKKEQAEFWEEFRLLYLNSNNDRDLFLERLEDSASGNGVGSLERGNASPVVGPDRDKEGKPISTGTTIEPLPEPIIRGPGRGRGNAPRNANPVIRLVRGIGRIFGIGNK